MRRKKFHTECQHKSFGKFCHKCAPNKPRDREKALAGEYGPKVQRKEKKIKVKKKEIK